MNILILGPLSVNLLANNIAMLREKGYNIEILNINKSNRVNLPDELMKNLKYTNFYIAPDRSVEGPNSSADSTKQTPQVLDKKRLTIFFWNKIKFESIRIHLRKFYERYSYYRNLKRFNVRQVEKLINKNRFDLIFSFWGANIIAEINIIKRKYDIPIVHSIQSYPYGQSIVGDGTRGDPIHEAFFKQLDGRIHSSPYMLKYFNDKFNLKGKGKDIVLMEYFKESYFCKKRLEKLSKTDNEPHLVFIGRTDFEFRDWDDIRQQVQEITSQKIHFHLVHSTRTFPKNDYLHFFKGYPTEMLYNGAFADDLTKYDACIVLYNINRRYDRFWNSLPLRFLSAIPAGIPIVLPKGYFGACEHVLRKYKLGFTYNDINDLRNKLLDAEFMKKHERDALKNYKELTFEKNFHRLENFFKEIIDHRDSNSRKK
ncbi:MAG: hypothetical protein ACTSSI_04225 [Candidatus Helarchaeota archaeon]